MAQAVHVDLAQFAVADEFVGRLMPDQPQLGLHIGQRAFNVDALGGAVLIAPHTSRMASLLKTPLKMRESMMLEAMPCRFEVRRSGCRVQRCDGRVR